jgi:flagellar hook-associated protein 2
VATTVTVTRGATGVQNALSTFVVAYNAVVSELDANRGTGTGALKGDSVLLSVGDALRGMAGYESGAEGLSSLTSLGLSFDSSGKLSLDSTAFSAAVGSSLSSLSGFLGTATGGGFLKTATDIMSGLEDATNGVLKTGIGSLQTQMTDQDARIATEQARIDQLRTDTQARMAAADALIASMEQQVSYLTGMFEAMRAASNSYY